MNMNRLLQIGTFIKGNITLSEHKLEHLIILHDIAKQLGQPLYVTSSFRTADANVRIGGSPTSSHLKGLAFDIRCKSSDRFRLVSACLQAGVRRLGLYPYHVHVDFDSTKPQDVIWLSSKK